MSEPKLKPEQIKPEFVKAVEDELGQERKTKASELEVGRWYLAKFNAVVYGSLQIGLSATLPFLIGLHPTVMMCRGNRL